MNENGKIWDEVNIDALKQVGYKSKREMIILFLAAKYLKNQLIIKMKKEYPNVQMHNLPDLPF